MCLSKYSRCCATIHLLTACCIAQCCNQCCAGSQPHPADCGGGAGAEGHAEGRSRQQQRQHQFQSSLQLLEPQRRCADVWVLPVLSPVSCSLPGSNCCKCSGVPHVRFLNRISPATAGQHQLHHCCNKPVTGKVVESLHFALRQIHRPAMNIICFDRALPIDCGS